MNAILHFLSVLTTGVIAGLFFSWSVAVMPGIRKLDDKDFILSMQSMNKSIQNPLFFCFFFGAPMFLIISCLIFYQTPYTSDYLMLIWSAILYLAGVLATTIIGNVPLNNMLENVNLQKESNEAIKEIRLLFERKWNLLNNVRTITSIAAFILLILRLIDGK